MATQVLIISPLALLKLLQSVRVFTNFSQLISTLSRVSGRLISLESFYNNILKNSNSLQQVRQTRKIPMGKRWQNDLYKLLFLVSNEWEICNCESLRPQNLTFEGGWLRCWNTIRFSIQMASLIKVILFLSPVCKLICCSN